MSTFVAVPLVGLTLLTLVVLFSMTNKYDDNGLVQRNRMALTSFASIILVVVLVSAFGVFQASGQPIIPLENNLVEANSTISQTASSAYLELEFPAQQSSAVELVPGSGSMLISETAVSSPANMSTAPATMMSSSDAFSGNILDLVPLLSVLFVGVMVMVFAVLIHRSHNQYHFTLRGFAQSFLAAFILTALSFVATIHFVGV